MINIIDQFDLVYEGHFHSVYCDGEKHVKTEGGTSAFRLPPNWFYGPAEYFVCDCNAWAALNVMR